MVICDICGSDMSERDNACMYGHERPIEAAAEITALRARLAAVEAERDQWARMIGEIAAQVPLPKVMSATSTVGDLVAYLKDATARAERAEAALATARRDALEEAARFVEGHEVGVHPRTGYVVAPSMIEGTQGTNAGMAYAAAIRALIAQEDAKP